jgi:hypothetical protein
MNHRLNKPWAGAFRLLKGVDRIAWGLIELIALQRSRYHVWRTRI